MYIHTQKHVHTHAQRHMYTHTHTHIHAHTRRHMYTHTCTYTQTHVQIHICTYTQSHVQLYMHTHTHTPIKSCSTSFFTHRSGYCTLGGGREHSTHSFLCFHCAQLLSSLTAPSANDRSGLSSEPAQQDGPGGHIRPTIISTRNWRAGEWKCQVLN
ncbi:unnamed protein product [Staurois parvus]|uniref:Uncharacterized protein n=1 Tax=Staurois parvus TaxID=386267 RepID=A0ABN9FXT7_9NEOB|nr:unnamed protein product [Staurois parvus]